MSETDQPWQSEELLEHLYQEKGLSDAEIGERLGCTRSCVAKWRNKFGITSSYHVDDRLNDPEVLERLYLKQELSTYDIAEKFDCCEYSVRTRLIDFDIKRKSQSDYSPDELRDGEKLKKLYSDHGMTTSEIGDRVDRTSSCVRYWMRKHGIDARDTSEALSEVTKDDLDKIESLYWEDEMSLTEISEMFCWDDSTIMRAMRSAGIERRSSGEGVRKHHQTSDGQSNDRQYYGPDWSRIRTEVIEEAGLECEICGQSREEHYKENGFDLHVHHVKKIKNFDDLNQANSLDNLICVCVSCHRKWEGVPVVPVGSSGRRSTR